MDNVEQRSLNPEAARMREEYNANLQRAFDSFGFTADVIKEIKARGNMPVLQFELDFFPSSWYEMDQQLNKFGGDLSRFVAEKTNGRLVSAAYLIDDAIDVRVPIWPKVSSHIRTDQHRKLLIFPEDDQIHVGQPYDNHFNQEAIPDNLRGSIVMLPEVVMSMPGAIAASYPQKE